MTNPVPGAVPVPGRVTAHDGVDAVTGAFSRSGAAIARELQAADRRVRTLAGHPDRAPNGTAREVRPLDFDDPIGLADSLVHAIKDAVGSNSAVLHVPGAVIPAVSPVPGVVPRDSLLTRDQYRAMAAGPAGTDGPAAGRISLVAWVAQNGHSLGRRYANKPGRHLRRPGSRPRGSRSVSPDSNKEWP